MINEANFDGNVADVSKMMTETLDSAGLDVVELSLSGTQSPNFAFLGVSVVELCEAKLQSNAKEHKGDATERNGLRPAAVQSER